MCPPKAFGRSSAGWYGFGALLFVALFLARDTLLQAAGDFLAVTDPLRQVDVTIAISGDGAERVRTASRLVREGYSRWLIVSGGPRPAEDMAAMARDAGVPADRIVVDRSATSTWQNALGSARLMRAAGWRSAILVTSPYHMRRAIILFRQAFLAEGLTVAAYSVPDSFIDLRGWWRRPRDREFVVQELLKVAALLVGIR